MDEVVFFSVVLTAAYATAAPAAAAAIAVAIKVSVWLLELIEKVSLCADNSRGNNYLFLHCLARTMFFLPSSFCDLGGWLVLVVGGRLGGTSKQVQQLARVESGDATVLVVVRPCLLVKQHTWYRYIANARQNVILHTVPCDLMNNFPE